MADHACVSLACMRSLYCLHAGVGCFCMLFLLECYKVFTAERSIDLLLTMTVAAGDHTVSKRHWRYCSAATYLHLSEHARQSSSVNLLLDHARPQHSRC
jgi:hypothetical protein